MPLARATDGCAPADRAARNHSNQAREPVTKRFGPRSQSDEKGKRVIGGAGGQQRSGWEIVHQHGTDGGHGRRSPHIEVREECGRARPHPSQSSQCHRHPEQTDQDGYAEYLDGVARLFLPFHQPDPHGRRPHQRHWQCRRVESRTRTVAPATAARPSPRIGRSEPAGSVVLTLSEWRSRTATTPAVTNRARGQVPTCGPEMPCR